MRRIQRLLLIALPLAVSACARSCEHPATVATPTEPVAIQTQFTLSGTVRHSVSGAAVSGAQLKVLDGENKDRTATTSATGTYTLANLTRGGFTMQISAANYLTQSRSITLTQNTDVVIPLAPVPEPQLVLADSTPANPQLVSFCVDSPCTTVSYRFSARNAGAGCAANVTGTLVLLDNNRARIAAVPFALPPGTVILPGQGFLYEACCVSPQTNLSWRTYEVLWSSTTVLCS